MRKRRKSRELALQVLYHWDVTGQDAAKTLSQLQEHFSPGSGKDEFAERIVLGVLDHREEIDRLIEKVSKNWRLDRMTVIDRNLLRLATFELRYCDDIPPKVALNEAIDLGKRFGSEESGSFINGILDRIQKETIPKPH
ncbi:MAG: transcription antitermination factor NusB [Deltaproteobacteria bacterium]